MQSSRWHPGPAVLAAMVGAAAIGAQYIADKAVRDTLFLANVDTTAVPRMIMLTSLFSIALVVASARGLRGVSPATWVPLAFAASGFLLLLEWIG